MKRFFELALWALLGIGLTLLWLNFVQFDLGPRNGLAALVAGTAERPFVDRQLAALLIRALMAVFHAELHQAAVILVTASFIGWLIALRWLLAGIAGPGEAFWGTLLSVGPVGLLFVSGGYVYDPLTLALFTFALALMARRQWFGYCLLFPLLVLCRETAIYLTMVFCLAASGQVNARTFLADLAYQLIAFAVIKLQLAIAFSANGGSTVEFHLREQLAFLVNYPLPNALALTLYGAGVAVALWRWRDQPPFLRAAANVLPLAFALYWLVGYPGEIRVFLEAYPILYLLVWHVVWTRAALPTVATIARWSERRRRPSPQVAVLQE